MDFPRKLAPMKITRHTVVGQYSYYVVQEWRQSGADPGEGTEGHIPPPSAVNFPFNTIDP